jgi:type I restriction enzyme S subunit
MTSYPQGSLSRVLTLDLDEVTVQEEDTYEIAGVYGFGRGLFKRGPIKGTGTSYKKLNRLHADHIVMSRLKAFEGAISGVPKDFDGWFLSPEFPTFKVHESEADVRYVRYICAWPDFWRMLSGESKGIGSRRERVSAQRLLGIKVPLPNRNEQHRIADALDEAFSRLRIIDEHRARFEHNFKQLRGNLLNGPMQPLSSFLTQRAEWEQVDRDTIYQTAGIYNHGRGMFARPAVRGADVSYSKYNRIHSGQFIYSRLFGWEGAVAVIPLEFDKSFVSHEFPTFEIDTKRASIAYVAHLARWHGLHDQLRDKTTGLGSRRQRVNVNQLLEALVPLPPVDEQNKITGLLNKLTQARELIAHQTLKIDALRSSLLNAAFTGQL